jgi:glycosyltransferase involved in cell wall biosynthesis
MGREKISVILPSLAGQPYISVAAKSTLLALGSSDELLILISGSKSKDASIEAIQDSRLKVFYKESPEGIVGSLNFLLSKTSGDLIARMDSDDICLPLRFRAQKRQMKRQNLDFIFSNAILFGREIRVAGFVPQIPYSLDNLKIGLELVSRNPLVHPTMLAKKSAIVSLGGYKNVVSEDYDLWLRAWVEGFRLGRTSSYGILYRVHPGQLTQSENHHERSEKDPSLISSRNLLISELVRQGMICESSNYSKSAKDALKKISVIHRILDFQISRSLISFVKPRHKVHSGTTHRKHP